MTMGSLALLSDIRAAYLAGYDAVQRSGEKILSPVRGAIERAKTTAVTKAARQRLEEHLRLLCTTICISGEEYVRTFPANLYVPLLTEILTAANVAQRSDGYVMNPLSSEVCDSDMPSYFSVANQPSHKVGLASRSNKLLSSCLPALGMQAASPVAVFALRALALIADMVPSGSFAFCPSRSKDTIATLALYLSDPEFLVVNEDLAEELLKCFLYVSMLTYDACIDARVPARTVEMLLSLEPHHLRVLCVQVVSNLLARARESDLEGVWAPVMAKLLESFDSFLLESSFRLSAPETTPQVATDGSSTPTAATVADTTAFTTPTAARSLTRKEATLLQHYMEAIAHAVDRLFVGVASMKAHKKLLDHMIRVCVQVLQLSLNIIPSTCGEWLRSVALSPILAFYLTNPPFVLPVLLQLHVWEAVCGCMLTLVERRAVGTRASGAAAGITALESEVAGGAPDDSAAMQGNSSAHTTSSAAASSTSLESNAQRGRGEDDSSNAVADATRSSAARRGVPALSTGPVLTTDVTTIPFIADELRLLPLLEFLLVLLPCARRGHSHTDFRHMTLPYFGWTWEDDFHNETECNEALSRRLERVYQQTRSCRKHELFAITHGKQRVFYTDFLSKSYVSERRERHCLHRKPLLTGYVHGTQDALLRGCTCCASEPAPRFSTWVNRNYMRLRTADTEASGRRGEFPSSSSSSCASSGDAADEEDGSQAPGSAPQSSAMARGSSSPSLHSNSARNRGRGYVSPSSSPHRLHRINTLQTPNVRASDADDGGGNRDTTTSPSASERPRGSGTTREGSGGATIVHHGNRLPHPAYSGVDEVDADDEDCYNSINGHQDEPQQRNPRRRGGGLGFLLCRCDSDTTASSQGRSRQMHMRGYLPETPPFTRHRNDSLAITVLPMEAVLESPGERLQADPSTRKSFLGKGVLSSMLVTVVPALLSVLDNCVNPVVARHSVTLLLRCLSLSADLRTQVTGESIELFTGSRSGEEAAVAAAASEVSEKSGWRRMSFRKWITGGSGSRPRRWQRVEWEATQAALQRLVPSLREVLVSLYVADGVNIVAERQETFGYMRDDLLVADELARVGLSTEFFGFQLALPSELHVCTADAIALLLRLFPSAKPSARAASDPKSRALKKSRKVNILHRPPRHNISGDKDARMQASPTQSMSSLGSSTKASAAGQPTTLAAQAALQRQHSQDLRTTVASLALPETPAFQRGTPVSQGGRGHVTKSSSKTHRPAHVQKQDSTDGNATNGQPPPLLSFTTLSRPSTMSLSLSANESYSASVDTVQDCLSKASPADSRGIGSTGVFTLHQSTLLVSYASQILRRSIKACAAAQQIHESMNHKIFHTRVAIGSPEPGDGGALQLQSRELTLRLFPDSRCPYHSTFLACTETFFHASQALLVALLAAGASLPATSGATAAAPRDLVTQPATAVFSPAAIAAAPSAAVARLQGPQPGRQGPSACLTAQPAESAYTSAPVQSQAPSQLKGGEELSVGVELPFIPVTVNAGAMQEAINRAMEDNIGLYRRLPPALRGLLGFYDYCKHCNIELRAAIVETPEILGEMATHLEKWLASRARQRENVECSNASFALSLYVSNNSWDSSSSRGVDALLASQQHLRLDSAARGKLLCLTADFATTIGRDLGLATLDLAPSVVMKQPCSFQKRAKRFKMFDAIRFLVWRPLSIFLDLRTPTTAKQLRSSSLSTADAASVAWGEATEAEKSVVMVGCTELRVVTGVKLRDPIMSVLPTTTVGLLAEAVAAQVQLPRASVFSPSFTLKSSQLPPSPRPLHASQERQSLSEPDSGRGGAGSPCLTSQNGFEERRLDPTATVTTASATEPPISADRILFFLNDTPLFSPMTTLLDALTAFAVSGASLRDLVERQRRSSESVDAHSSKISATLPTLPFWTLTHALEFVVLAEPLPASLILGLATTASASSATSCCCCGCDGFRPAFLCSPKHLFDAAPPNGPLALFSALSTVMREEVGSSLAVLESNQQRLSSAVVHELYHQLKMFMLPPLLWCSGIGVSSHGGPGDRVVGTAATLSSGAFPLPSYVLWRYPFIFSAEMRLSIFRFFISAQRSLSHEEAKHLLQNYRHLLVRHAPAEEARAATSGAAGDTEKTLNIVGLQWLSEEVVRRRRVTLTVQRHNILRCAEELIRLATCNVTIDVAFEGEAGIGNGPAMEFYEMVAEELLDPKHDLWRTEPIPIDERADSSSLRAAPSPTRSANPSPRTAATGAPQRRRPCAPLFPAAKQTSTSLHYWKLLGVLLGRLLVIGTTSSLYFHPLLLRRLRGESLMSTADEASQNMSQVDAALELTLHRLETMNAGSLAACELFFTIPVSEADGYVPGAVEELPLIPGGANRQVTVDNVHEYTHSLRAYYLHTVPDLVLLHLRQGLQLTVNPLYLQLFTVDELGRLLGSPLDSKVWETREQFARDVEAAHGYHIKSDVVQYLLDIVPTWSAQMQHAFLKFVTGSSAVPYGGLTQRIKVVRRDVDVPAADLSVTPTTHSFGASAAGLVTTSSFTGGGVNYDNSLPTVSTCFLYLKLPRYSSKAVLQDRLRFAVCEGQSFFSLT
ncbi:ubiquitin-protein ligase / HECT5 [Leishmania donovani]|nr:ubiquitin-protein ligase / HECT5 [Leishmania donovani]